MNKIVGGRHRLDAYFRLEVQLPGQLKELLLFLFTCGGPVFIDSPEGNEEAVFAFGVKVIDSLEGQIAVLLNRSGCA